MKEYHKYCRLLKEEENKNCYDLMRALHFANKLKLLIENCPRTLRNEDAFPRVSVPEYQTKDAIEELKLHLESLLKKRKVI